MAAPVKKTLKKPSKLKKAPKPKPISVLRTEQVKLTDLQMFHKNPRIGDVDSIAESLRESGQYKAICVNVGTFTGRKNEILAGNHTYLGTKKNGEKEILASFVDVDDEQAAKIVLADNRTADSGTYDEAIIAELFEALPDVVGTGYTEAEMNAIMQDAQDAAVHTLTGLEEDEAEEREQRREESFEGTGLGDPDEEDDEFDDEPSGSEVETRIEKQSDELPGLAELKELLPDTDSFRTGEWGIPKLRADMLVQLDDIPANLRAWAGSATKDWPDLDQWWLYNWGIDSTSGMKDVSKVIVSFYTMDDYFENWFWNTKKYVAKLMNSRIKMMVTPNYSMNGSWSMTLNLWALYRARYVGRYAQEAGIKVIPDVNWTPTNMKFLKSHILPTLPKKVPVIALQLQTQEKDRGGAELEKQYVDEIQTIVDTVQPEGILLYANPTGHRFFTDNIAFDGELIEIETRLVALGAMQSKREKKKGI